MDAASPTLVLRHASPFSPEAQRAIGSSLNTLLADVFALYLKTKNFHWHMNGPHFRDYHLLLDDHGNELFGMTDPLAERVRKIGLPTLRSINQISSLQRVNDNEAEYVEAADMLSELRQDNSALAAHMREAHEVCDKYGDVASASLLENWIDDAEKRIWFLFESARCGTI